MLIGVDKPFKNKGYIHQPNISGLAHPHPMFSKKDTLDPVFLSAFDVVFSALDRVPNLEI
jgi:hypothetical protein